MTASSPGTEAATQSTERPSTAAQLPTARPSERSRTQSQGVMGKSLKLKGTITGSEDLYIDGELEGTIELQENTLTVGPNGNVRADVRAREITVLGRLTGNVRAGDRVDIRKTGSLEGDLTTSRIAIEDGAVFRGSIDITKAAAAAAPAAIANANKKPTPASAPSPTAPTAEAESPEKAAARAAKA